MRPNTELSLRYCGFSFIFLAITVVFSACSSPQSEYEKACGLLGEREYEKAGTILQGLDGSKLENGNIEAARLLAKAGPLIEKGEFDKALEMLNKTYDIPDREMYAYQLNISPDDPLSEPARNIVLLLRCKMAIPVIEEMLDSDPDDEDSYEFVWDGGPEWQLSSILESEMPDYETHAEGMNSNYAPIFMASFANTNVLPAFASELVAAKKLIRGSREQVDEKARQIEEAEKRRNAGPLDGTWAVVQTWNMHPEACFASGSYWVVENGRVQMNIVWPTGEREIWNNNWTVDESASTVSIRSDGGQGWDFSYSTIPVEDVGTALTLKGINGTLWQFVLGKK